LCENHFSPESFNPKSVRKALKRDAIPIPYDLKVAQDNPNKCKRKRNNCNKIESYRENTTELSYSIERNDESFTSISDNVTVNEQLLQKPPLKTYKPAKKLCLETQIENDMMEWVNIEPSKSSNEKVTTVAGHNTNKKNETISKKNNNNNKTRKLNKSKIIIESLKKENIQLQKTIRRLKYRQRIARLRTARKSEKPKGQKQKIKMI
jgi:hypothetical protein